MSHLNVWKTSNILALKFPQIIDGSHLNVWKASNILALKFPQIIDGMNVLSFKYLGLEVPSNHRWNECATRRLEAGKRAYYAFENTCNHGDIKCWVLRKYLFDTLVTPVLLYGVVVSLNLLG